MTHMKNHSSSFLIALVLTGCFAKESGLEEPFQEGGTGTAEEGSVGDAEANADANEGQKSGTADAAASSEVVTMADVISAPASAEAEGTVLQFDGAGLGLVKESARIGSGGASTARGLGGGGSMALSAGGKGKMASGHGTGHGRIAARAGVRVKRGVARPMPVPAPPAGWTERQSSTEEYTDHGVNPFTMVEKDAKSTFSIDVDTASYTMARRKLKSGVLPAWEGVRAEEFVNFFEYDYRDPRRGPFAVHMEAMPDPFRSGRHIMRVGVQAKRFTPEERPPLHLTFLVDVSGSMSSPDKIGLAKKSMHTLVENLQEGDTVAMATYAGRTARILEPTGVDDSRLIHSAIDSLRSGGSTAMSSGIELAYDMADDAFEKGAENRVIILSDGDANVGRTSWEDMLKQIKGYADQGITLSTIGYGQGNYRDTLMEQLANKGDGNNFYVDSAEESNRIFGEKIGGTMITVARDTKIQVEFNPEAVEAYRLIGYENRDIADKDFRNDRVDAGEVGSGHSVTALYEVILNDASETDLATVRVRWEKPGADKKASEREFPFDSSDLRHDFEDASEDTRLAYAAATFAEVLRQSPHAADVDLADLRTMVSDLDADKGVRELARLMSTAERLGAMNAQADWQAKK